MAYDPQRSSPLSYDHSQLHTPDPRDYQSSYPTERRPNRSRASSSVQGRDGYASPNRSHRTSQQFNEPNLSAFDKAGSDARDYPPELVEKIKNEVTEDILRRLKNTNLDSATPQSFNLPPSAPSSDTKSDSPDRPPRTVYTPPSPHPVPETGEPYGPPLAPSYIPERARSPRPPPAEKPAPEKIPPSPRNLEPKFVRPAPPTRLSTGQETTPLEKKWDILFDERGRPTPRLGQFLRGLANHIIENYEPKNSIVVTPTKMARFYNEVTCLKELYTWNDIFKGKTNIQLCRIYRELECQHHFVQEKFHEVPSIPGLTPVGFEKWMSTVILAHPEEEYERLQNAVIEMPISNADDRTERFPKEISRRLFPPSEDPKARELFERALQTGTDSSEASRSPRISHLPPKIHQSDPPPKNNIERERKPYSTGPSESAIDDLRPNPPLERERKPYAGNPSNSNRTYEKAYDTDTGTAIPGQSARHSRTNSVTRGRPAGFSSSGLNISTSGSSRTDPFPEYTSAHPSSSSHHHHHHRTPSSAQGSRVRRRSPSFSTGGDYRRSDTDIYGSSYPGPSSSSSSFMPPPPPPTSGPTSHAATADSFDDDPRGRYARDPDVRRADWSRRQAEEAAGGIDIPGSASASRATFVDPSSGRAFERERERERERDRERERERERERDRERYERYTGESTSAGPARRGVDYEDYYRGNAGRGGGSGSGGATTGSGYDYTQPYPPAYR